ncbi:MAG: glycosyltransferase [Colwellia sp.]
MSIVFITDSPVWSLGKGLGAPSFYNTLKLYNDKEDDKVVLLTTEKNLDLSELNNIEIVTMPKLPLMSSQIMFGSIKLLNKYMNFFLSQFIGLFFLFKFTKCKLVYGYEIGYIPAIRWFSILSNKTILSRFQGTVLTDLVQNVTSKRSWYLKLKFLDHIWSLKTKTHLTIMTDDGTKGNNVLNLLRGGGSEILFIKNGVDVPNFSDIHLDKYLINHSTNDLVFSSVSRLQSWKRLDRSISIFSDIHQTHPNSHYYICGDGSEMNNLKALVETLELNDSVTFLGAVDKGTIYSVLLDSQYFLSTYELSNLGNPLFEAIRCNNLVVTIDNGDTSSIIKDGVTGIISSENNYILNSEKAQFYIDKPKERDIIIEKANKVLDARLVTWDTRMEKEYKLVKDLFS